MPLPTTSGYLTGQLTLMFMESLRPPAKGSSHSYSKERQIQKSIGTLVAAFDGSHGWFWRNRTNRDVTLQLTTTGEYQEIKRVI